MSLAYVTRTVDPQSGLRTSLGLMLQKQTMVDMTLICSSHSIRVHKAVLAANSFYLEKIITHFRDDIIIVIRDMSFQAMRGLVEYMYCGRTRLDECYLNEMMSAGKYLQVLGISNLKNMEGKSQDQENTEKDCPKFELAPEGGPSVNRPVIFIRLNEKKDVNPGKVPIVMEINSKNSKTHNSRKESKPEIKSEETKPNTDNTTDSTSDVEILRIPFELKNNKPVRNQIKEFIGETMPELILKPRRGRPSVKSIMERSLIKNNGLFQITLDNSDETLRSEEMLSKRTIAKMEKQIYGRDIQQQFVIEQAVSSIVDNDSTNFDNINDTILKTIAVSPENLRNDESASSNDFTDMNLLIDNDYYTNEVVPQVLSISDIEALNADGNVEYQNLDELTDSNNFSEQNFTILTQEGNNAIEYSYINNGNTDEGDTIIYNTSELVDYEGNAVFANQLTYNLENGYYEPSAVDNQTTENVSNLQIVQQQFDNIPENGNISNFIDFANGEITYENNEPLATNEVDNGNIIYETSTSGFPNIGNIYNEVSYANNDMPVLLNDTITQNDTSVKNVDSYQHDSDIFNVIRNNEDISTLVNNDLINTPLSTENDVLEALNSESDLSETLKDNIAAITNNNININNSRIHNNNSFSETNSLSKSVKSLNNKPETHNNVIYDMYNRAKKLNQDNEFNSEFSQYNEYDESFKIFNRSIVPNYDQLGDYNSIFGHSSILGDMNDFSCGNNSLDDLGLNYNQQNGNYSPISEVSFKLHMDNSTLSHIDNEKPIINSLGQYDDFADFSPEDLFADIKVKVEKTSEHGDDENSTITECDIRDSIKNLENVTPSSSKSEVKVSQNTDIPEALGLLPVRDALEKFQNICEFKPRKTRGNIQAMLGEKSKRNHLKENRSSENLIKKRKIH